MLPAEMMVPFVPAFTAVGFNQFDTPIFNAIDGSDMLAVCADYFRMLFDLLASVISRLLFAQGQRVREPSVQFAGEVRLAN
jgi:hypothetical protein